MDARSHIVIRFNILFPKFFIAWTNDNKMIFVFHHKFEETMDEVALLLYIFMDVCQLVTCYSS